MSSVWNPSGWKRTLPPLRIVTLLGKKAFTSDEYLFWNSVDAFGASPIPTVFGLACAAAAGISTTAAAVSNAAPLAATPMVVSFRFRSAPRPKRDWAEPNLGSRPMQAAEVRITGVLPCGRHWPLVAQTPWRRPRRAERLARCV